MCKPEMNGLTIKSIHQSKRIQSLQQAVMGWKGVNDWKINSEHLCWIN